MTAPRWYTHSQCLIWPYGLVILDADSSDLKRSFFLYKKEELLSQTSQLF
jgi:hypothetical protein